MKKILFSLLVLIFSLTTQALRADDAPTPGVPKIVLDERNANTPEMAIDVPLSNSGNGELVISLQGMESNSKIYCSGAGNHHGYRWEYDNGGVESDVLTMISERAINSSFLNNKTTAMNGWITKEVPYEWTFSPKQIGSTTLTFKKYYYSNATVRNTDGSLLWQDPVEILQFNINVVDGAVPAARSK